MKSTQGDYRKLRLRNLNSPEFSHLKLLLGWGLYFVLYSLTERLIPETACHVVHCALDDKIPFCEYFAFFYAGWYFLIAASLGYFLLRDVESFRKLQIYIILVQLLATAVYILWPTRHELRPDVIPRENVFSFVMALIYRIDTPTGVCPSLHVAISLGIASVWLGRKGTGLWLKGLIALFCLGVCLSVAFVKQHSVVDIAAAIPLWLMAEWVAFYKFKC